MPKIEIENNILKITDRNEVINLKILNIYYWSYHNIFEMGYYVCINRTDFSFNNEKTAKEFYNTIDKAIREYKEAKNVKND